MARAQVLAPFDRVVVVRSCAPFQTLDAGLLAEISRRAREHRYRRGDFITAAGDPYDDLHLLVEGRALVTGLEHDGELLEPTVVLAPLSFLATRGEDVQAKALDDVVTLAIDRATFDDVLTGEPAVAHAVIAHLAEASIAPTRGGLLGGAFIAIATEAAGDPDLGWVARLRAVEQARLFPPASVGAWLDIARILEPVSVPAGTTLWRQGDVADGALLVVSGRLQGTGGKGVDFSAGAGFQAGLEESLCAQPRWYDAQAETHLHGFGLASGPFLARLVERPDLTRQLVAGLASSVLEPPGGRAR